MNFRGHYIDGAWRRYDDNPYRSTNPFTGETVFEAAFGQGEEVELAVGAAARAFKGWRLTSFEERAELLRAFGSALEARKEELAQAISQEMGKTLHEARIEAGACAGKVRITLEHGSKLVAPFSPEGLEGAECVFRPLGVMAVVGPYNFPAHLANGHIVPALMTGNTVVFKPSSVTPLVGQIYAEAAEAAGFPPGVFNMLQIRRQLGDKLLTDQRVKGILFTGSYAVGLHIKRITLEDPWKLLALEMGGKNCSVVLDDAHLQQTVTELVTGSYLTTGQRCTGTARIIATRKIAQDLESGLVEYAGQLKSGDPQAPNTFMGPLATLGAKRDFLTMERQAEEDSAFQTLVKAGDFDHASVGVGLHRVLDYNASHPYLREEVFGPALTIEVVDNVEEALARACESDYGLSFSIFSKEKSNHELASRTVPCGIVNWNRATNGASGLLPFGGLGKSGNHRPAALFAPYYCTYPVAQLQKPYGKVESNPCPGFPKEVTIHE